MTACVAGVAPSPWQGGVGGNQQSAALLRRSGSALQGRTSGWDGGENVASNGFIKPG
jgi:hypothetical protein